LVFSLDKVDRGFGRRSRPNPHKTKPNYLAREPLIDVWLDIFMMDQPSSSLAPFKSALFVDFDNIYIGLSKSDPQAAERFASDPARWLTWLEKGLPSPFGGNGSPRPRSVLIRRCYPNPDAGFRRFRSYFTSAAFSVIDCPSLTRTGKNSSDIYMVMDILDTLNHKTFFDEFIIFSGDSDFMPVLLRLRAHNRRTTTLAVDFMPPAYKAACDLVISEEEFIEEALGVSHDGTYIASHGRGNVSEQLLNNMAARVYQATCDGGEVAGADLPDILKDFREFRDSTNWLGFGTSQRLAEALAHAEPRLQLVRLNAMMYKIILGQPVAQPDGSPIRDATALNLAASQPAGRSARSSERSANPEEMSESNGAEKLSKAELARMRRQVVSTVKEMLANSSQAILLARASQYVVSRLGSKVLESQWAGAGSFKRMLQNAGDRGLEITTHPEPGYVFDPKRHTHPGLSSGADELAVEPAFSSEQPFAQGGERERLEDQEVDHLDTDEYLSSEMPEAYDRDDEQDENEEDYAESLPSLEEFIRRVSRVTGAPDLTTEQYKLVFRGIVHELNLIATGEKNYNTYQSSKAVSDWCTEQGETISRSDLVLIFKGIIFQDGVRFGKRPGSYTEHDLAVVVFKNIWALCRRARLELSEYEECLLKEWILGKEEKCTSHFEQPDETSDTDTTAG